MQTIPIPSLPRGVRIHHPRHLYVWHPHGVLNLRRATEMLRFIETEEKKWKEPYNRFADLSGMEAVHLNFAEIEALATRRRGSYHGEPVKSAFLATNPLAFGIARMYGQLVRWTPIEVRVFCRLSSAAAWLGAPIETLLSGE